MPPISPDKLPKELSVRSLQMINDGDRFKAQTWLYITENWNEPTKPVLVAYLKMTDEQRIETAGKLFSAVEPGTELDGGTLFRINLMLLSKEALQRAAKAVDTNEMMGKYGQGSDHLERE